MPKVNSIFTLVCVNSKEIVYTRCFGYFFTEAEALKAIEENRGNMAECYYDYLILEEFPPGVHACSIKEIWYQFNNEKNKWEKSKAPENALGVCNFALG